MNKEYQSAENYILLKSYNDGVAAYLACGLLEANGIDFYQESKNIGPITGELDGPIPGIRVYVHKDQLSLATKLLESESVGDDLEFKKYKDELKKRGWRGGRIMTLLTSVFFGWLAWLPKKDPEDIANYFFGISSALFFFFFFCQLVGAWKRKKRTQNSS